MPAPKGHAPYNVNGEGGRPRKYSDEDIDNFADKFDEWLKDPTHVWFKDFFLDNDLDTDYLSIWGKSNVRFAGVLKKAKTRQESRLINGALTSGFNSNIVKFTLNVHHGWIEKKETVHTNNPDNPVPQWIMKTEGTSKDLVNDESES